jgi:hypothetical protein
MPHLPDHQTHDPLVIAALAAGDAEGADLEQARELVASCSSCADLQRDLRAISAALPVMPAPVRTRDFRLTPEQAASIRPAGWRRFLAPLAGPRFAFAAPLGGSLAALGIAGILVASFAAAPIAGVRSGAQGDEAAAPAAHSPDVTAVQRDQSSASSAPAPEPELVTQASAAPLAGGANPADPAPSGPPSDTTVAAPAPTENVGRLTTDGQVPASAGEGTKADPYAAQRPAERPSSATDVLASPFTTLAGVLVAAGIVLLVTRLAARRLG